MGPHCKHCGRPHRLHWSIVLPGTETALKGDFCDNSGGNGTVFEPVDAQMPPVPARIKVYLAGPMTGLKDLNFPAFNAAAAKLRASGLHVVNPAELNPDHSMPWEQCMRVDIAELVQCDWIAVLPGWDNSKGARLEHHIATSLGMPVLRLPESMTH